MNVTAFRLHLLLFGNSFVGPVEQVLLFCDGESMESYNLSVYFSLQVVVQIAESEWFWTGWSVRAVAPDDADGFSRRVDLGLV